MTIQHYCTLHFYEWTGFSASQKSQSLRVKGWIRSLTTRMSNSYGDVWLLDTHYRALQQTCSITIFPLQHIWGKKSSRQLWSPVQVLRMMQWSMMGLQLTVISRQWWALWCWADLSSGLNCNREHYMHICLKTGLLQEHLFVFLCIKNVYQTWRVKWWQDFRWTLLETSFIERCIWRNSPLLSYILHTRPLTPPWTQTLNL